jgi:hypothetical protein
MQDHEAANGDGQVCGGRELGIRKMPTRIASA